MHRHVQPPLSRRYQDRTTRLMMRSSTHTLSSKPPQVLSWLRSVLPQIHPRHQPGQLSPQQLHRPPATLKPKNSSNCTTSTDSPNPRSRHQQPKRSRWMAKSSPSPLFHLHSCSKTTSCAVSAKPGRSSPALMMLRMGKEGWDCSCNLRIGMMMRRATIKPTKKMLMRMTQL